MAVGHQEASTRLRELEELRRRTRTSLQSFWYPLVVFGAITLASAPLCELAPGWALGVYWLVGAPAGAAAVARHYRLRELELGVTGPALPYIATGAFIIAAALTSGTVGGIVENEAVAVAGPTLAVAAGYLVFARLERSVVLAAFAVGVAVLAVAFAGAPHACSIQAALMGAASVAIGAAYRRRERQGR